MQTRERENELIAQRIRKVRAGLRQEEFAAKLGLDQTTISKWERGKARPTPDALVRIASIAEGVDKLFFLGHAGLPEEYFEGRKMIPEIAAATARVVSRAFNQPLPEPEWVPLMRDAVAAGEPLEISEKEVEEWLPFSKRLMPAGSKVRALRVSGDSMSPIIDDGYVVIIDVAQRDPRRLVGRMVAAREGDGVTVKWLRKDKNDYLLVPQHVSQRIAVRVMRPSDDWGIVGVVLKWIGYPPPARK